MSWPIKNAAFTFYVTLVDSAARPAFKANPTLASGDVKVSIDGGAFANLGTLPDAEPNSGRAIRVIMAQAEMNGDDIMVQFVDAAGAEWDDLIVHIQTTARGIDDVATQTSVNTIDDFLDTEVAAILAAVDTEVAAIKASTDNLPSDPADASVVAGLIAAVSAKVDTIDDFLDTEIAAILADTNELQTDWTDGGRLDNILDARASQASVDDLPTNAELATALAAADDAVLAAVNDLPTNAELATALAAADDAVLAAVGDLPTNAELATALAAADDAVLAAIPSAAAVADAVWDEALAGHLGAGSTGEALSDAGGAGTPPTVNEIADGILDRDMSTGTDSGSASVRTVRQALRVLRNKWSISGTTVTYTKENDSTTSHTAELTGTSGADPVTSSDPAGP